MDRRAALSLIVTTTLSGCSGLIQERGSTAESEEPSDDSQVTSERQISPSEEVLARLPEPTAFDPDYEVVTGEFPLRRSESAGREYRYRGDEIDYPSRIRIEIVVFGSTAAAAGHFQDLLEQVRDLYPKASEFAPAFAHARSAREYQTRGGKKIGSSFYSSTVGRWSCSRRLNRGISTTRRCFEMRAERSNSTDSPLERVINVAFCRRAVFR